MEREQNQEGKELAAKKVFPRVRPDTWGGRDKLQRKNQSEETKWAKYSVPRSYGWARMKKTKTQNLKWERRQKGRPKGPCTLTGCVPLGREFRKQEFDVKNEKKKRERERKKMERENILGRVTAGRGVAEV